MERRTGDATRMIPSVLLRPAALLYLRIAPAAAGGLLLALVAATTPLPVYARGFSIALLVASVLAAFIPKRAEVRTHGAVALAIVAVAFTGQTRAGAPYIVGCGLFSLVILACVRAPLVAARLHAAAAATSPRGGVSAARRERSAPRAEHRLGALAVLLAVMAGVTAALVTALPPAGAAVERQVQRMAGNAVLGEDDQVGFSTNVRVGSLRHMLSSDRVVMRIDGEAPEYLRGVVLDFYKLRL